MTRFLSNRDGGKTDEKGHLKFLQSMTTGDVFSGGTVTQNGTPNMTVNVSELDALIRDAANGYAYHAFSDGIENVQITTANASNARKDYIVAYVDRAVVPSTATSNNPNIWKLISVAGTPAGSPVYPTSTQIQATAVGTNPYIVIAGVNVAAATTTITNASITDLRQFVQMNNTPNLDWHNIAAMGATMTFSSWNANTRIGVINTSIDLSTFVRERTRIKMTQTTGGTKFFIVHKVTATQITGFFGTDYTLINEAIATPFFSNKPNPADFPLDPLKWTLSAVMVTDSTQPSAVQNTWYNLGGHNLPLGVGAWTVYSKQCVGVDRGAAGRVDSMGGISTSASTASDAELIGGTAAGNGGVFAAGNITVEKTMTFTTDTTLYAIQRSTTGGISTLYSFGQLSVISGSRVIRATSAYL